MDKHDLPPPPDGQEVLNRRYIAYSDDWWLETAKGWFWFDQRKMSWMPAPLGPP